MGIWSFHKAASMVCRTVTPYRLPHWVGFNTYPAVVEPRRKIVHSQQRSYLQSSCSPSINPCLPHNQHKHSRNTTRNRWFLMKVEYPSESTKASFIRLGTLYHWVSNFSALAAQPRTWVLSRLVMILLFTTVLPRWKGLDFGGMLLFGGVVFVVE